MGNEQKKELESIREEANKGAKFFDTRGKPKLRGVAKQFKPTPK